MRCGATVSNEASYQQRYYAMKERVWNLTRELAGAKFQLHQLRENARREAEKFLADTEECAKL